MTTDARFVVAGGPGVSGQVMNAAAAKTWELIGSDQKDEAFVFISDFLTTYPLAQTLGGEYVDAALFSGHYQEAFEFTERLIGSYSFLTEDMVVKDCLASALVGREYPGQFKHAYSYLQDATELGCQFRYEFTPPENEGLEQLAVICCLALGVHWAAWTFPYLELCLQWDPLNTVAAERLIYLRALQRHYSRARKVVEDMLNRLSSEDDIGYFLAMLKAMDGRVEDDWDLPSVWSRRRHANPDPNRVRLVISVSQ